MHLKSFSTYGFKSFADKTELTFDKGITAVVGPNGSGKSNISDAIRWVLGEQSAKYLRGSRMEDVIFSGSSKRRALGAAEVTLNFDNSDHSLPLDFDEVSLTRRIYRSGDSDYAINKKSCRLKDIIDLMADTGLGRGSMSIIGQNKIDEILNSRPEDRRALFEEAAGIAKYRLRKKDAVRRLDDTSQNLTRISDIRSEVENQLGPLEAAAEKTRRCNELSAALRLCRLTGLLRHLDEYRKRGEELEARKKQLEEDFAAKAAALSSCEAETASVRLRLQQLAEEFSRLQDEIKNRETALEKLRGQSSVLDERAAQSARASSRLEDSCAKLAAQAGQLEKQMKELAEEYDRLDNVRAVAELQVKQLQQEKEAASARVEELKQQAADKQSEFFAGMQEMLKQRNELRALEQEQEQRVRRRDALKHNIEEAEAAAAVLDGRYRSLLEEQARAGHTRRQLQQEQGSLNEKLAAAASSLKEMEKSREQCQRKLLAAETREQSLRRMQEAYEGFGAGTRAVLKSQAPWRGSIIGVAAEVIKVAPEYVTAIETALGEGAQNIITADAAAAKQAIAYLKSSNAGRATFLPLDTVQKRVPSPAETRLQEMPGIRGFAADLIGFSPEVETAVRFLLGRVLIAENIDAALAAARAGAFRIRAVTLDGDVINTGGSMSGGSRRHRESYLSRARGIEEAAAEAARLRRESLQWQEQYEEQEQQAAELQRKLQEKAAALQQLEAKTAAMEAQAGQLQQEKARTEENLSLLLDERGSVTAEYMASREKVKALREAVSLLESRDTEAKSLIEQLQKETAAAGSALTALENRLQDARIRLETSSAKTGYMAEQMKNLDADTLRLRSEISSSRSEQERLAALIAECGRQKEEYAAQSAALLAELKQITSGREDYAEKRRELLDRQEECEKQASGLRSQAEEAEAGLRALELEMARHSSDRSHAAEQLQAEYGLDEEAARREDTGRYAGYETARLQKEERRLALDIVALGPVNQNAIEEYEAVLERSRFLQKQYSDLCQARGNLEAVIAEINSGMSRRFREAFTKINGYFADCYVKIFGGGTAVLKLTDSGDILNSGIDIEVQPPGKKLQSLFLMSGGERALTVIALLFALLSYQPSPFCILDEIDAPLDDANIARFSRFLREYSANTQFIVITHRKGTMESADILYGVTMEESGVSKLLSVKINEKE